jgi:predicted transcriptional regulator
MAKTILHRLFSSRARAQLVVTLFADPEREYYMRELSRTTGEVIGSVQRELDTLEELDLITCQKRANAKFYRANQKHYLFQEMKSIVAKTAQTCDGSGQMAAMKAMQ